jgi:hypothetical protein
MMFATLRGDSFGQGAHALSAGENALVLFMLALHCSVLCLIFLVAWFTWHRRQRSRLPTETEALLEELASPLPHRDASAASSPWERDADWWKPEAAQDPNGRSG